MKDILLLFFAIIFSLSQLNAQKLDSAIQSYYQARGNESLVEYIKSYKMTFVQEIPQLNIQQQIFVTFQKENKMKIEFDFEGQKNIQVRNNPYSWFIMPSSGVDSIVALSEDESHNINDQDIVLGPFAYNSQFKNVKIQNDLDNENLWKITQKNLTLDEKFIYLNKNTKLLDRIEVFKTLNGRNAQLVNVYEDYKDFDGILFPTKIRQLINAMEVSNITIKELKFNLPIEEKEFEKPTQ